MQVMDLCRICLASNIKMYPIEETYYYEIIEISIEDPLNMNSELPYSVCYLCNAVLNKFYKFLKHMICMNHYLKEIIRSESQLTPENIDQFKLIKKQQMLSKVWLNNTNYVALETYKGNKPPWELQRFFKDPPIMITYHMPYEHMDIEPIVEDTKEKSSKHVESIEVQTDVKKTDDKESDEDTHTDEDAIICVDDIPSDNEMVEIMNKNHHHGSLKEKTVKPNEFESFLCKNHTSPSLDGYIEVEHINNSQLIEKESSFCKSEKGQEHKKLYTENNNGNPYQHFLEERRIDVECSEPLELEFIEQDDSDFEIIDVCTDINSNTSLDATVLIETNMKDTQNKVTPEPHKTLIEKESSFCKSEKGQEHKKLYTENNNGNPYQHFLEERRIDVKCSGPFELEFIEQDDSDFEIIDVCTDKNSNTSLDAPVLIKTNMKDTQNKVTPEPHKTIVNKKKTIPRTSKPKRETKPVKINNKNLLKIDPKIKTIKKPRKQAKLIKLKTTSKNPHQQILHNKDKMSSSLKQANDNIKTTEEIHFTDAHPIRKLQTRNQRKKLQSKISIINTYLDEFVRNPKIFMNRNQLEAYDESNNPPEEEFNPYLEFAEKDNMEEDTLSGLDTILVERCSEIDTVSEIDHDKWNNTNKDQVDHALLHDDTDANQISSIKDDGRKHVTQEENRISTEDEMQVDNNIEQDNCRTDQLQIKDQSDQWEYSSIIGQEFEIKYESETEGVDVKIEEFQGVGENDGDLLNEYDDVGTPSYNEMDMDFKEEPTLIQAVNMVQENYESG